MRLDEFDFQFPERLIATQPVEPRDHSRLLVVDRTTGLLQHKQFLDLPQLLRAGDLLVFNDTKVFPARLFATKPTGGAVELLLVRKHDERRFTAMVRSSKGVKPGQRLRIADGFFAEVIRNDPGGFVEVTLDAANVQTSLHQHGHIPLPPYMQRADTVADRTLYQTMFADREGSAAAPTAGLHFTPRVLDAFAAAGIATGRVTLHVGPGTFMPVRDDAADDVSKHVMHHEWYELGAETVASIAATKARGGRVVAVGTTSVRTLESVAKQYGALRPASGDTDLFVLPGFEFKVVDAMVTNFHQPKSTLLMLISAFAGLELVRHAYREAIAADYRLFSYGDACLLL